MVESTQATSTTNSKKIQKLETILSQPIINLEELKALAWLTIPESIIE